jgi:Fe-S cluster biogenesis protein NfuA
MDHQIKQDLTERVEAALQTIRPHLIVDGGNVELVEITEDKRVLIRWIGMCETCSMSEMTLKAGINEAIKSKVPEIIGVEATNGIAFAR